MGRNVVVVGAQWGDEGKGKIVDVLAERFDIVARYQGGPNAGHTVFHEGKRLVLQLMPCGVLRRDKISVIGSGVTVEGGAAIINSILMDRIVVGHNCKINMAIIDKDVVIPPGTEIGYDPEADKRRFHVDPESNIIVIRMGYQFS